MAVLAIAIGESAFMSGAGHMMNTLTGYTFDLGTGKHLALRDVLLPAGVETLRAKCLEELGDAEDCAFHVEESEGPASFTVEPAGLRLELRVPMSVLVPWSELAITQLLAPYVASL